MRETPPAEIAQVFRREYGRYTAPEFGNPQAGRCLPLDMGKPVTITNTQITLGA